MVARKLQERKDNVCKAFFALVFLLAFLKVFVLYFSLLV